MHHARSAQAMFLNLLGTLDHLVETAQAAGVTDDVLAARLAVDMFPLELQFRVALNQVLLALNQVGGGAVPLHLEAYASLTEVRDRIADVRGHIAGSDLQCWAAPTATVDLTLPNGVRFVMTAEEDLRDWLLPNFHFHVTMVYALLRHAGLPIGKMDFLPHMKRHQVAADR